jgi:hypothetical protein
VKRPSKEFPPRSASANISRVSKPKDSSGEPPAQGGGRNAEADFHGQKRSNDTHASTTDPYARLYRKGKGKETKLCFIGHGLMENRHGLHGRIRGWRTWWQLYFYRRRSGWRHRSRRIA